MPDSCPCEKLWIQDPSELIKTNILVNDVCESNNINAFTRVSILGLLLGYILSPMLGIGAFGFVVLILILLYHRWIFAKVYPFQRTVVSTKENFEGASIRPDLKEESAFPSISSPGATLLTKPTARNPFMNVLLDEITYNPNRPVADPIVHPMNQIVLDEYFRVQWNSDPTDVFGRTQGQRQFYTMPSSSIPNDQGSYQNWLYLIPGKTCKEGNGKACIAGSQGAVIPWLSSPN
jgi:hypothetical protein